MQAESRVVLFTGEGKGKTTAALGMVLRAAGHGMPALVVQFIKGDARTGEVVAFGKLTGVELRQVGLGFVPPPGSPRFEAHRQAAQDGLKVSAEAIASGRYGLVVLDEVCGAVAGGLLEESAVVDAVRGARPGSIVVLTGRRAGSGLVALADTVTEMHGVKHGYATGIKAQAGVEY